MPVCLFVYLCVCLFLNVSLRSKSFRIFGRKKLIREISHERFDIQKANGFCLMLNLSPRLYAFLNKGIFDHRINYNNNSFAVKCGTL